MKKRAFALFLALALCAALLAGCGNTDTPANTPSPAPAQDQAPQSTNAPEETSDAEPAAEPVAEPAANLSPEEAIVGSYYSYGYDIGFWMDYFFHFYDEVPGIGKVYYAGFALNQIVFNGIYDVVEQEKEYACWPDRETVAASSEGDPIPTGTAPYTVNFYDFDGNLVDSCAFDGDHLYMDMTNITGTGGGNAVYNRDTDPENSAFSGEYEGEKALAFLSLVNPDDPTGTLDLLINGKYKDMVVFYVEGTFSTNADQSEITLTPASAADNGATVTKNADGTYTYKSEDGTEVVMKALGAQQISYTYVGEVEVPGAGVMGDLICDLYDDGTARLYASAFGTEMDLDAATYEIDMTTHTINFVFEHGGEIATYFTETGMAFDYAASGLELYDTIETTLNMVQE